MQDAVSAQEAKHKAKADYAARESALWAAWHDDPSAIHRHELVEHYAGWTRVVARDVFQRVRIPGTEWADYVHYATIGLLECIDRFDGRKGVHFQTYARHRLRGAILNNIGKFSERAGHALGTSARYSERADSLAITENDDSLIDLIEISVGLSIGYLLELGSLPVATPPVNEAYQQLEAEQIEASIAGFVEQLPDKERIIIQYHYFQQMSFVDIAALLELTKGRISQLHRNAITRIRELMSRQQGFEQIL